MGYACSLMIVIVPLRVHVCMYYIILFYVCILYISCTVCPQYFVHAHACAHVHVHVNILSQGGSYFCYPVEQYWCNSLDLDWPFSLRVCCQGAPSID